MDYKKEYKEALGIAKIWNKNTAVPKECKEIFERFKRAIKETKVRK